MQPLHKERLERLEAREGLFGRFAAYYTRPRAAADSESDKYLYGRHCLDTAGARTRQLVGRHADHCQRTGDFWRGGRKLDGGGCGQRPRTVEVSNQSDLESVAYDLHVRWQTIHRRGCGAEHYGVRNSRLAYDAVSSPS